MKKILVALIISLGLTGSFVSFSQAQDTTTPATTPDQTTKATRAAELATLKIAKEASHSAEQLTHFQDLAKKYITERIDALNSLTARIQGDKKLTSDERAALLSDVNSTKTALTTLQTKTTSDTDLTTLKADIKSVFNNYRVFEVLIPKTEGLLTTDRMSSALNKLQTSSDKIKTLIDKAGSSGKDTTQMLSLYNDAKSKLVDAKTQIDAARAKFLAMKASDPTGAQKLFADGKTLLKLAKADLSASHEDLQKIIPLLRSANNEKTATNSASPSAR